MSEEELRTALAALYAYDTGDPSGVCDEGLRRRCIAELRRDLAPGGQVPRVPVGRIVRELYLTEEAMTRGYGPEDAHGFLVWLLDSGAMA